MRTGTKILLVIVAVACFYQFVDKSPSKRKSAETQLSEQELQDAKDFAQALVQRNAKCDKVTAFSNANFAGRVDIWCDNQNHYVITKPNERWIVKAQQ
ncbi:hypothetical protein [Rahnella sp. EDr1-12]|uniref:hypothetical protein n=1 Tax=unclassified Rahnella TaxID=2635087 RepID=UPI003BAD864F